MKSTERTDVCYPAYPPGRCIASPKAVLHACRPCGESRGAWTRSHVNKVREVDAVGVGRPVKHPWQGGLMLVEYRHQPLPPVSYPMALTTTPLIPVTYPRGDSSKVQSIRSSTFPLLWSICCCGVLTQPWLRRECTWCATTCVRRSHREGELAIPQSGPLSLPLGHTSSSLFELHRW